MSKSNPFYTVTEVKPNVWAIEDAISSEHTICYLICGSKKALLFDTGLGISPLTPVLHRITDLPITVVLSHSHFDHCGAAHEFDNLTAWQSESMKIVSTQGVSNDIVEKLVGDEIFTSIAPYKLNIKPFSNVQFIDAEQTIDIGGYSLKTIHTPGHTEDSICLYEPTQKWIFTGDTLYPGPIYLQFENSNIDNYHTSIDTLNTMKVDDIFPGHNATHASPDLLTEITEVLKDDGYISQLYPRLSVMT